jgi:Xaa-Pro aminopeptidase
LETENTLHDPSPPDKEQPSFESPRNKLQHNSFGGDKLNRFRAILNELGIDAFIVDSGDAHQSEYVSKSESRREFISGFTGSAGTALILQDKALLWTDGRYFLQASQELSAEWTLMKSGEPGVLDLNQWLVKNLKGGNTVGVDSSLISNKAAMALKSLLEPSGITLKGCKENPVDKIWGEEKPADPKNKVSVHDIAYAGVSHIEKIEKIRMHLKEAYADRYFSDESVGIIFSMLDEIMWLYNIRGADVDYNPVAYCYALVTNKEAILFIDKDKLTGEVTNHLTSANIQVLDYFTIEKHIKDKNYLADPAQLNWLLYSSLKDSHKDVTSPITYAKSIKNSSEIHGIIQSHIRDGVALTSFLAWLENQILQGNSVTEYEASNKLAEFRYQTDKNVGLSFCTIAGYSSNGIHYDSA